MPVTLTCYLFKKLTNTKNQSNNFNFLLNYNASLSSSCLIIREIKRDLSQIFGVRLHVPLLRWTRHARMYEALHINIMPRLGEQIFSLNPSEAQCLKTCWFNGGTVILFLLVNCPTLKNMEQKTSSDTTGAQPAWPKKWDGKTKAKHFAFHYPEKFR